jgi:hypothetical protein
MRKGLASSDTGRSSLPARERRMRRRVGSARAAKTAEVRFESLTNSLSVPQRLSLGHRLKVIANLNGRAFRADHRPTGTNPMSVKSPSRTCARQMTRDPASLKDEHVTNDARELTLELKCQFPARRGRHLMRRRCADPTGTGTAICTRADSSADKNWSGLSILGLSNDYRTRNGELRFLSEPEHCGLMAVLNRNAVSGWWRSA